MPASFRSRPDIVSDLPVKLAAMLKRHAFFLKSVTQGFVDDNGVDIETLAYMKFVSDLKDVVEGYKEDIPEEVYGDFDAYLLSVSNPADIDKSALHFIRFCRAMNVYDYVGQVGESKYQPNELEEAAYKNKKNLHEIIERAGMKDAYDALLRVVPITKMPEESLPADQSPFNDTSFDILSIVETTVESGATIDVSCFKTDEFAGFLCGPFDASEIEIPGAALDLLTEDDISPNQAARNYYLSKPISGIREAFDRHGLPSKIVKRVSRKFTREDRQVLRSAMLALYQRACPDEFSELEAV